MKLAETIAAFIPLGLVISWVVVALHEPDLSRVWGKGLIAFLKLVIGSVIGVLAVWWLYILPVIYTYIVLALGFFYIMPYGGEWMWRRYREKRAARREAS